MSHDHAAPPALEPVPRDLVDATLRAWGVTRQDLQAGRVRRRIMLARRACVVALSRSCPSLSLADIAAEVGFQNHTSVLYARRVAGVVCQVAQTKV